MFTLLGFKLVIPVGFEFLSYTWVVVILNAITWLATALVVNLIVLRFIRYVTRQLPGELEDIVFAILRGPLVLLLVLFGIVKTMDLINLSETTRHYQNLLTITIVVITITHILGRVIKDILVYYGNKWALKTESKLDDVLIPVLNLFGPVVLVLGAGLIILPLWGFNVTSVLVGAGVIGLVLGLALQSTLANIFSGLSLLVEAPFKNGDLITLTDGRICEVQGVGLRSTRLYSVSEHATVYVPNTTFSTTTLTNISNQTVDKNFFFNIKVPADKPIDPLVEEVKKVAVAHPATLVSNMQEKVDLLKTMANKIRADGGNSNPADIKKLDLAVQLDQVLPRLELEGSLNNALFTLLESLRNLVRGIKAREAKGLTETERQELFCNYISPVDPAIEQVVELTKSWSNSIDPWLDPSDHWNLVRLWEYRNSLLLEQWEKLKKTIYHPDDHTEMRLDDMTRYLLDWIQHEYKVLPEYWKNPTVYMKGTAGSDVQLQVSYYVDNIRLEHDERANRVQSEIAFQIQKIVQEYN
jgi:MscS family membrane protein